MNLNMNKLTRKPRGLFLRASLLAGAICAIGFTGYGQNNAGAKATGLSLEYCVEKAVSNYPMVKQYGLIEKAEAFSLSNASKGYLPQFSLSARATYQSEVTQIPVSMPGITPLNKDQYQAVLELNQTIWDGGAIESQKKAAKAASEVEKRKNETDLYALRERVNQLFFGILLLEEQIVQNGLLQKELNTNYKKVSAYLQNGVATKPDLDAIKVEQLKASQRLEELTMTGKTFREMLAVMTGDSLALNGNLIKPQVPAGRVNGLNNLNNNRPELKFFDAQKGLYSSQESAVKASVMPKFNLFMQGGYGNPGLNMLKLEVNRQSVELQKETFLFNSRLLSTQQKNEIDKLSRQLSSDEEIISLRHSIKVAAEVKVENGTLSVSDLIREINAENLALQEKAFHEIQLLSAIHSFKTTLNEN
ncbi:MAG: outer rane efflux protein [Bacteroidetes bacterium]|nr:outer rane efflux protein [Bacteroidota bacterium]